MLNFLNVINENIRFPHFKRLTVGRECLHRVTDCL